MPNNAKLPKLPVVGQDTIYSTLVPLIDSNFKDGMDSYFEEVLDKIKGENPLLYEVIEGRTLKLLSDAKELGLDEDITNRFAEEIIVVTGIVYGLLSSQLEADYLNAELGLK